MIRITGDEFNNINESSHRRIKSKDVEDTLIDVENGTWIKLGVPEAIETGFIPVPNEPHVFEVDELVVNDRSHNGITIKNVNILIGHGHRINSSQNWSFLNGQSVVQTFNDYNDFAFNQNPPLRPIEFIVSCNLDLRANREIKIGEFNSASIVAYVVGEEVSVTTSLTNDNRVIINVRLEEGEFFGIDNLIGVKESEDQINI